MDDEDTEAVTLTVSGGSSIDFNKREECAGETFFARPVVVPSTRPVMGLALEYLDCASIKMTPLRRQSSGKKKQLLMSSEISHNNVGQSDLRQTLSGWQAASSLASSSLSSSSSSSLRALDNFSVWRTIARFVSKCGERT